MKEPVDIGGGWKAMPINGLGVLVQAEMGLIFIDGATIDGEKNLVVDPDIYMPGPQQSSPPQPPAVDAGFRPIDEFLENTSDRDLTPAGVYGPLGPMIKRFRDLLKVVLPGSPLETSINEFLAAGDRMRYGPVASIVGLSPAQLENLEAALTCFERDRVPLEDLLDELVIGSVTAAKVAMDESTPGPMVAETA